MTLRPASQVPKSERLQAASGSDEMAHVTSSRSVTFGRSVQLPCLAAPLSCRYHSQVRGMCLNACTTTAGTQQHGRSSSISCRSNLLAQ